MVYVTVRPFSYYFLKGTEVNFTVTSPGGSHHLNESHELFENEEAVSNPVHSVILFTALGIALGTFF